MRTIENGELCCNAFPDWCGIARQMRAGVCCRHPFRHKWNLGSFLDAFRLNDGQRSITAARSCKPCLCLNPGQGNRSNTQPGLRRFRRLRPERARAPTQVDPQRSWEHTPPSARRNQQPTDREPTSVHTQHRGMSLVTKQHTAGRERGVTMHAHTAHQSLTVPNCVPHTPT